MRNFDAWMKAVDQKVVEEFGLSVYDLPDCPFRDWFDDGLTATEAFEEVIEYTELEGLFG